MSHSWHRELKAARDDHLEKEKGWVEEQLRQEGERRLREMTEIRRSDISRVVLVEEYLKEREAQSQEKKRDLVDPQMTMLKREVWEKDEGMRGQEEEKSTPGKTKTLARLDERELEERLERMEVLMMKKMDDQIAKMRKELREEDEERRREEEERRWSEIVRMMEERERKIQKRAKQMEQVHLESLMVHMTSELDQRMARLRTELREEDAGRRIETSRMMKERERRSQETQRKMEQVHLENVMAVMIRELDQRMAKLRADLREEEEGGSGEITEMANVCVHCPSEEMTTSELPSETSGGIFAHLKKVRSDYKMRQQERNEKRKAKKEEDKQKKKEETERKQKEMEHRKEMKVLERRRKGKEYYLNVMKNQDMEEQKRAMKEEKKQKEEKDRQQNMARIDANKHCNGKRENIDTPLAPPVFSSQNFKTHKQNQ